jgi:NAD-dependent DNA ligase
MKLPLWLKDNKYPKYLRNAARKAGEEVLTIETVPEDVRETVAGLRTVLILWSWLYYNGEPEVTDEIFDAAFKYLRIREIRYPELITSLSPTQTVGKIMEK